MTSYVKTEQKIHFHGEKTIDILWNETEISKEEHELSQQHVYLEPSFLSWESPFLPPEKFLSHAGQSGLQRT